MSAINNSIAVSNRRYWAITPFLSLDTFIILSQDTALSRNLLLVEQLLTPRYLEGEFHSRVPPSEPLTSKGVSCIHPSSPPFSAYNHSTPLE